MAKKSLPLIFVLIFNLWLIRILNGSILIGILIVLTTIFLYYKKLVPSFIFLLLLIFFQYKTSSINPLTYLNEQEKTLQIQRMHGYPSKFARWANWLEARPEALVFYKLEANLKEAADPNLYFFANHPRERVGVVEYEKFPYLLLPFFIIGIFSAEKEKLKYLLLSLTPLILISLIGNTNSFGPFSLFPFVAANISSGLMRVFENKAKFLIFAVVFGLIFIQTIAYATY